MVLFFLFSYRPFPMFLFFFFNDTATTEIYTLSLHDALPISARIHVPRLRRGRLCGGCIPFDRSEEHTLNSSHRTISYAVFCLKKKKTHLQSRTVIGIRIRSADHYF